jgi:tetratricopeptide (TPR) repeat protein
MENKLYYVESPDGQVLGPMTMIHVLEGIAALVILETARICEVGDNRWISISDVAHTREEQPLPPPLPPLPPLPPRAGTPERAPLFVPASQRPPIAEPQELAPILSSAPDEELLLDDSTGDAALRGTSTFEPPRPAGYESLILAAPPVREAEPYGDAETTEAPPWQETPVSISLDPEPVEAPVPAAAAPLPSRAELPPSALPFEKPTEGAGDFVLGTSYAAQEPETDWRAELDPQPRRRGKGLAAGIAAGVLVPVAAAIWWLGPLGEPETAPQAVVHHAPRPAPTPTPTALEQGWDLLRRGEAAEAIIAFQQAVDEATEDAAAQHGLGRAAFDAGKLKMAIEHLEEAARLQPNSAQYVVDLAYGQLSAGRHDLALAAARRALELSPEDPTGHLIVGRALAATGDAEGAVQSLSTYVGAIPDDLPARLDLARALVAAGRTEAAIPEADRFLETFPDDRTVQHDRLRWMQSVGRNADAAILYATLAAQSPQNAHFLYLAGIANPGEDGVAHLQGAVALEPGNGDAWALLGTYLTKLGRHADAVAALEKAFERRPATDEEFALLSQAKSAARRPPEEPSREESKRAAAETLELKSAIEMIRSALSGGSPSRARKALEAARAELKTPDARRHLTLWSGIVALEQGEFETALERFRTLPVDASFRESGYGVGAVRNWMARTHLSHGDLRSAITVLDYVSTDDPNEFAFARLWEGISLATLGMDDLAGRTWRRIAEEVSGISGRSGQAAAASASFLLGQLSEKQYRTEAATLGASFENDMHFVLGFAASRAGEHGRARIHYMRAMEASVGREFPWYLAHEEVDGDGLAR